MGGCALDSCQEGYGPTDGSCEYANVLLSSTTFNEIFWLDQDLLASHAVCYSSSHKLHHDMAFLQNFRQEVLIYCVPKHLQQDGFLHV